MTNSTDSLNDCPYCGGVARVDCMSYTDDEDQEHREYSTGCVDCGVLFPPEKSKQVAIDLWNRRDNTTPDLVEASDEEIASLVKNWDGRDILAAGLLAGTLRGAGYRIVKEHFKGSTQG